MTALAWPSVALVVVLVAIWRVDVFARRWGIGQTLGKRVSALEAQVAHKAGLDELAVVRDKLHHLDLRVPRPR